MRISDWSSDVCSSDLARNRRPHAAHHSNVTRLTIDILDDDTLAEAGRKIAQDGALDLLIVATGLLHRRTDIRPEKSLRQLERSEEHTSELQSLMRISYAVFCLKQKKKENIYTQH